MSWIAIYLVIAGVVVFGVTADPATLIDTRDLLSLGQRRFAWVAAGMFVSHGLGLLDRTVILHRYPDRFAVEPAIREQGRSLFAGYAAAMSICAAIAAVSALDWPLSHLYPSLTPQSAVHVLFVAMLAGGVMGLKSSAAAKRYEIFHPPNTPGISTFGRL